MDSLPKVLVKLFLSEGKKITCIIEINIKGNTCRILRRPRCREFMADGEKETFSEKIN